MKVNTSHNGHTEFCVICEKKFSFSNGSYGGKYLKRYCVMVCNSCYEFNHDGWNLQSEKSVTKNLSDFEISLISRNESGFLPRE